MIVQLPDTRPELNSTNESNWRLPVFSYGRAFLRNGIGYDSRRYRCAE